MAYTFSKSMAALTALKRRPLATELLRKLLRIVRPRTATPLRASDTLWLYDNIAFSSATAASGWTAEFIAAYFLADSGRDVAAVVAQISEELGLADDNAAEVVAERVQPFLDLVLEGRTVEVDFAGAGSVLLGPSDAGGVSVNVLALPGGPYADGQEVRASARLPAGIDESKVLGSMRTRFAGADGWGVVSGASVLLLPPSSLHHPAAPRADMFPSPRPPPPQTDIDDTIKVTEVRDRVKLLRHTFALQPEAVAGTPALYGLLDRALRPAWFYLSASPYNLYPTLSAFVHAHYPQGQLLLREMTFQELESFVRSLTVGTQQYKESELARLLGHLPARKWVFVGDSTQKDPESYAATYRRHPHAVKHIWIRIVEGVNLAEERALNSDDRFASAFRDVPTDVWRTYRHPAELQELVGKIV